jgi:hypothetical protein
MERVPKYSLFEGGARGSPSKLELEEERVGSIIIIKEGTNKAKNEDGRREYKLNSNDLRKVRSTINTERKKKEGIIEDLLYFLYLRKERLEL